MKKECHNKVNSNHGQNLPPELTSSSIMQQVLCSILTALLQPWSFYFDLWVLQVRAGDDTPPRRNDPSSSALVTVWIRLWQTIPPVRTTGWQIHADGAALQFFFTDQCSLTANWSRFCFCSQLGENWELYLLGVWTRLFNSAVHFRDVNRASSPSLWCSHGASGVLLWKSKAGFIDISSCLWCNIHSVFYLRDCISEFRERLLLCIIMCQY